MKYLDKNESCSTKYYMETILVPESQDPRNLIIFWSIYIL